MTLPELENWLRGMGQPAYRARQVWEWIYKSHVIDFAVMRNLPAALRTQLAEVAAISAAHRSHAGGLAGA